MSNAQKGTLHLPKHDHAVPEAPLGSVAAPAWPRAPIAPRQIKVAPHALSAMKAERDAHANIALKHPEGSLARWQADERVKQLDTQIARVEQGGEPDPRPMPEPFIATGIPGGDGKAYGRE